MNTINDEPISIVIFGASGDLTHRKLIPSLYNLYQKKRLPEKFRIVGFSRTPFSNEAFRQDLENSTRNYSAKTFVDQNWASFSQNIEYFSGNLKESLDYENLYNLLQQDDRGKNILYYLAISPKLYETTVTHLGSAHMQEEGQGRKHLLIEKPFGEDLESAKALNNTIHSVFNESQIFRIDHYLGKETAQNILFFRFANTIFEPIWNRRYISNIQLTVSETVDVAHRSDYYDKAGVLRDMFQNHLMQLLTFVAMEPATSFEADILRNEKVKVLHAIRKIASDDTVLAQYEGYCDAPDVAENSRTPTYAALKLFIDNWRWQGVPFYLRSGKALRSKSTEIAITFQTPPHVMFQMPEGRNISPNVLSICIQPDEGIHLEFQAKQPDSNQETRTVIMDFHYSSSFGECLIPDAYERLLLDAMMGDASLFARSDEIEHAWRIIDPVISEWEQTKQRPLASYSRGSNGPADADMLLAKGGNIWQMGCARHD